MSHISQTQRICHFMNIDFLFKITLHSCNRPSHISHTEHTNLVNTDISPFKYQSGNRRSCAFATELIILQHFYFF